MITLLKNLSFAASLVIKEFQRSSPKTAVMEAFPVTKTVPFTFISKPPENSCVDYIFIIIFCGT
jgi:hypothetical protein